MSLVPFFCLLFLSAAIGWAANAIFHFLFQRGMSAGELRARLEQTDRILYHSERRLMTVLDDLNAKVDALQAEVEVSNGKTDEVIAVLTDVKAQLAALTASTVTDADLKAIGDKIDVTLASVKTQEAEDDSALSATAAST